MRAKTGTAIKFIGDGGVADILKAGADYGLKAAIAKSCYALSKKLKNIKLLNCEALLSPASQEIVCGIF